MLCFLGRGFTKQLGQVFVTQLFGHIRKEQVLAVGHALAAESGFEIGVGGWLGEVHRGEAIVSTDYA